MKNFFSTFANCKILFFLALIFFACLPIWSVEIYLNQDGSPHLYNSYIILELLKQNSAFTDLYALNPAPLPNLSGHYFLSFLLIFFPPFIVTKLMMTLTFAAFVASIVWLRSQICGNSDSYLSILIGTAMAFNWLWFLGFYNFIIGVIGFAFTIGLYWRWRENLNFRRSLILFLLLLTVFFSHLISFGMLAGALFLLSVFIPAGFVRKNFLWTLAILISVLPFVAGYRLLTAKGGEISPVWRFLNNPFSISDWIYQLQAADPFQLLSRKAFPFFAGNSGFFAFFSPFLWLTAAMFCLFLATYFNGNLKNIFSKKFIPFTLIFSLSIVVWIVAPDDFGKSHGGFLRERVLLCGMICFIPLFQTINSNFLKYAAAICLSFIIVFQTATLWEYAETTNLKAREFLSGYPLTKDAESLGSIILVEDGCRFKSIPMPSASVLYGLERNTRIWDNYEIGFYLFPVVAKNSADQTFTYDFREAGSFNLCDPNERLDEKFAKLNSILESNNDKINVILVWGDNEKILPIISKWYEAEPFFQNGRLRLFRHR